MAPFSKESFHRWKLGSGDLNSPHLFFDNHMYYLGIKTIERTEAGLKQLKENQGDPWKLFKKIYTNEDKHQIVYCEFFLRSLSTSVGVFGITPDERLTDDNTSSYIESLILYKFKDLNQTATLVNIIHSLFVLRKGEWDIHPLLIKEIVKGLQHDLSEEKIIERIRRQIKLGKITDVPKSIY
jgi:hypothetical protein